MSWPEREPISDPEWEEMIHMGYVEADASREEYEQNQLEEDLEQEADEDYVRLN